MTNFFYRHGAPSYRLSTSSATRHGEEARRSNLPISRHIGVYHQHSFKVALVSNEYLNNPGHILQPHRYSPVGSPI